MNKQTKNKRQRAQSRTNGHNSLQAAKQPKPLKKFGQHFLRNPYSLESLLEAIDPQEQDCFIEIGPGDGALTLPLSARCKHVIAIEIDRDMVEALEQKIADAGGSITAPHNTQTTDKNITPDTGKTLAGVRDIEVVGDNADDIETSRTKSKTTAPDNIKNISIIQADALKDDLDNLYQLTLEKAQKNQAGNQTKNQGWRMVGNLPYNISAHLIERFLMLANFNDGGDYRGGDREDDSGDDIEDDREGKPKPPAIIDMHFLVQKEIAQRLFAAPGSSNYSRLSLMRQTMAQGEKVLDLSPRAFSPPPKVMSSFIRLRPQLIADIKNKQEALNLNNIISSAFHRPNRLLSNTLQESSDKEKLTYGKPHQNKNADKNKDGNRYLAKTKNKEIMTDKPDSKISGQPHLPGQPAKDWGKILSEINLTKKRAKETTLEEFIAIMHHSAQS